MNKRKTEQLTLRQKAEKLHGNISKGITSNLSEAETIKLAKELQVHQIELELQNEELKIALTAAQEAIDLYDFAPTGYFTILQDGSIGMLNLFGAKMLGKERAKLTGCRFGFFVSNDTKPIFNRFLDNVFASQTLESCEVTLSLEDNDEPMYVSITGRFSDNINQCLLTMVDIIEQRIIEKELREKIIQHETTIQTAMDGFWMADRNGFLQEVNEAYCRMSGYRKEELIGKNITDLVYDETSFDTAEHIKSIIGLGETRFESRHQRKDGTIYTIEASVQYKGSKDGHFVVFLHDITNRKIAELELNNRIEDLATINKKLEIFAHANEELEQFAFIASHNMQQPLRTISNYVNIINEDYIGQLDEKALQYLNIINSATSRMLVQLRSLLDFSRLGRSLILTKVDCKQIIDNVIADLETMIKQAKAIVVVENMPELDLYQNEFHQLIQNLISNAIKFKKKDVMPKIVISSEKLTDSFKFSVSDNGIGIDPKNFDKIFQIFQRLHLDSEYQGNGIGLAFCKKIVELHKGEIWVESSISQGTTFHFTIADLS